MTFKLYRHSGLPPCPEKFKAFKDDFALGFDEIVKEHGEFCQENSEAFQKAMFALEQGIFEKYPRMEIIEIPEPAKLNTLVGKYGSLCFVQEENSETKEQELVAYVMDGPLEK